MGRLVSIYVVTLWFACPLFANSVKAFESQSRHPNFAAYSHREAFSSRENRSWEIASSRKHFDFDDSEKNKVHSFHRSERVNCGPVPSVDPAVASAVPEVPTAWLVLLGTVILVGSSRLRSVLAPRS